MSWPLEGGKRSIYFEVRKCFLLLVSVEWWCQDGEGVEVVGILRDQFQVPDFWWAMLCWAHGDFFFPKAAATSVWTLKVESVESVESQKVRQIFFPLPAESLWKTEFKTAEKTLGREFVRFCWWCGWWASTIQTTPNNQKRGSSSTKKADSLHSIQTIQAFFFCLGGFCTFIWTSECWEGAEP